MPDTPTTPGQVCYEAYYAHVTPTFAPPLIVHLWFTLSPGTRDAWEAAAQAVLALALPSPERPEVTTAVAAAQAVCDAESEGRDTVRAHFRYAIGARLRLAGTAPGPWTVQSRRWIEREVLGPYAEYGLAVPDGTLAWEVEADLEPWEENTSHA